jgi:hypothetical protein
MLREAIRARRPAVNAFDLVLRLRRPCAAKDIADAVAEARRLLGALGSRTYGPER